MRKWSLLVLLLLPLNAEAQENREPPDTARTPSVGQWATGLNIEGLVNYRLGVWRYLDTNVFVGATGRFWGEEPVVGLDALWLPGSFESYVLPTLLGSVAAFGGTRAGQIDLSLGAGITRFVDRELSISIALGPRFRAACASDSGSGCGRWGHEGITTVRLYW